MSRFNIVWGKTSMVLPGRSWRRASGALFVLFAMSHGNATLAAPDAPAREPGVLTRAQLQHCERLGADFARTGKIIKMYRAYTGDDGESKIETIDLAGQSGVYYGGKVSLTQFAIGDPTSAVIVYGHPNMAIPAHPSPYREIFLILSGSSTVELKNGERVHMLPGSLMLSEDQTSHSGRAGRSGPCGYVAIDFQFKPVK
jgi:mannose-6-phosphate isomerase-like protein (cupin superfamily)